jgi:Outer membrane lipoprotein-sorting protein
MLPMRPRQAAPAARRPERGRAPIGCGYGLALLTLFILASAARAQKESRPPPNYAQLSPPDQAEGRAIVEGFRQQGIAGDYYLEFELQVLPRHGAEQILLGRLWGSRNAAGPVSRVSVLASSVGSQPTEVRWLIQSGPMPQIWRWKEGAEAPVAPLDLAALFEPMAGTNLTAFDLQMPFLYWPEFVYEGLARMHGRPAHQFLFYLPDEEARRNPTLRGVRAYLDTQYTALVQVELIGENDQVLKTLSVLDLKKIGEQWIVKSVDCRDEATRNKTRFAVTAAALNQRFSSMVFDPKDLAEPAAIPGQPVKLTP